MSQQYPTEETRRIPVQPADRVIDESPGYAGTAEMRTTTPQLRTEYRETVLAPRDHVRWGPSLAGAAVGLGVTAVMAVLGLAIGSSAFEPGTDVTDWTTSAGVWGAVTVFVAFLIAGWVAGRAATTEDGGSSALTGFVAGAVLLVTLMWLTTVGVTNLVGFLGANFSGISSFATEATTSAAGSNTFSSFEDGAWATFAIMVVGLALAAIGGFLGHQESDEFMPASM